MLSCMRHMGIDYGTKRVGVAFSDELGAMAFPHTTYENDGSVGTRLSELARAKHVGTVVIGHSIDREGVPNPVQGAIDTLATKLRTELEIPVHLEEERYSTQAALRLQGRTAQTDASAAALILDAYLTRTKNST